MTPRSVGERREELGLFRVGEIVEHGTLGRRPRTGASKLFVCRKLSMSPARRINRLCRHLDPPVYEPDQLLVLE
jgi:hypothetical protein